jgi:hypothetical protein
MAVMAALRRCSKPHLVERWRTSIHSVREDMGVTLSLMDAVSNRETRT